MAGLEENSLHWELKQAIAMHLVELVKSLDGYFPTTESYIVELSYKLQAPYLCKNNANYFVCPISKNIAVIKTFNVSKHKKSRVHFSNFKTWVYLNMK